VNHQQTIDVDAVLPQSRGIRHERRSDPRNPFLGLSRIIFRQCLERRHEQAELADSVAVDEYFGDRS
jgi:hypothetical protein